MDDLLDGAAIKRPALGEPISRAEQIVEIERELGMRRRTYRRWVDEGRLTRAAADYRIAALEAVLQTLRQDRPC